MYSISDIRDDDAVKQWLGKYDSENTLHGYLSAMKKYANMLNMSPTELLDEAIEECGDIPARRKYLKNLKQFRNHLKNGDKNQKPLAEKSVNFYVNAIVSFYKDNEIPIQKPPIDKSAKNLKQNDEVPTVKEMFKVLHASNLLLRTYMLVATSSGLSVSDIVRLRVKDVQNIDDDGFTTLKLRRHKSDTPFYTFLSPEATEAVNTYIDWRNGEGVLKGKAGKEWQFKHRINSDEDYLFIKDKIKINDYKKALKVNSEAGEEYRKLTEYNVAEYFRSICKKLGCETDKGNYNTIRSHICRKYFISTLEMYGMGIGEIHFLSGKELPKGYQTYSKPDGFREDGVNEWKARYKRYVNHLMFEKEIIDQTDKRLEYFVEEFNKYKQDFEIRLIEVEMNTTIKPYEFQIKDIEYQINESKTKIESGEEPDNRPFRKGEMMKLKPEDIENKKRHIKFLEGEIQKMQLEIDLIREPYMERITKMKTQDSNG